MVSLDLIGSRCRFWIMLAISLLLFWMPFASLPSSCGRSTKKFRTDDDGLCNGGCKESLCGLRLVPSQWELIVGDTSLADRLQIQCWQYFGQLSYAVFKRPLHIPVDVNPTGGVWLPCLIIFADCNSDCIVFSIFSKAAVRGFRNELSELTEVSKVLELFLQRSMPQGPGHESQTDFGGKTLMIRVNSWRTIAQLWFFLAGHCTSSYLAVSTDHPIWFSWTFWDFQWFS